MISKAQAQRIFDDHSMESSDWMEFINDHDEQPEYELMDVLGWLGYCCPSC